MSLYKGYIRGPLSDNEQHFIFQHHKSMPVKKMGKHIRRGFNVVLQFLADNNLSRYVPPKRRSLRSDQVLFIMNNYKKLPVWKMARHVKTTNERVQSLLTNHQLPEYTVRKQRTVETKYLFNSNKPVY